VRLLIIGGSDAGIAALYHEMRVEELNDLDPSYTPPVSSPWNAVQAAARTWQKSNREFAPAPALKP
jgi:hypothetical protein